MQDPYLLLLLVLGAVASLVGGYLLSEMNARIRRRARRERQRLAAEVQETLSPPVSAPQGITPERVAFISRDAHAAAWRAACAGEPAAPNPHPANTREFVLWEATFHSALSDFSDLAPDPQPPLASHSLPMQQARPR